MSARTPTGTYPSRCSVIADCRESADRMISSDDEAIACFISRYRDVIYEVIIYPRKGRTMISARRSPYRPRARARVIIAAFRFNERSNVARVTDSKHVQNRKPDDNIPENPMIRVKTDCETSRAISHATRVERRGPSLIGIH